jgi:ATPase subunit of ABC transporter with duplicated ATPase domains
MSGSRRETEAEKAKRKRKEADDKNSQTAESRAARANSRSANDDGLVEAAANSRRRVSQAGSPSPLASPVPKAATRKRLKGKGATLESSSDDEVAVAGAASSGKTKLMKGSSVKSHAEVKLFKIYFLRSFFNSLIRDFSQRGVGSSKAVVVARSGQPKQSQGSPSADLTSQVQN